MPHDHAHMEPKEGDKRVAIAIWANGLLTVAQIVGGILSGSLALIADAIHNFSDMASLVIAFGARKIELDPDTGMWLNGRRVKMRGFCDHSSFGGVGVKTKGTPQFPTNNNSIETRSGSSNSRKESLAAF